MTEENKSNQEKKSENKSTQKENPKNREKESLIKGLKELENIKKRMGFEEGKRRPDGKKGNKSGDDNQWKKSSKTLLIWVAIVTVALIIMNFMEESNGVKEFSSINEFNNHIDNIKSIEITNVGTAADATGVFKEAVEFKVKGATAKFKQFSITFPFIEMSQAEEWERKGVEVKFAKEGLGFSSVLLSMIPWILIIFLWIYILRRMQGGGGQGGGKGIFTFGKSRAKLFVGDQNPITFNDVAGAKEAKEELEEVIGFLKSPDKYNDIGAKIPKGVLLLGSPGTGKTLLAKAVAGEAGVPFFSMSGADFVEMFVGVGASRVRDLFEQARKQTPCIIFIDELDAVGRHRGTGIGGGNDEREQTLNQLLVEMDGFESKDTIILIAATNRPDVLDPALLRPGRFDRQIVVDRPDVKAREQILEVHAKKVRVSDNVKLDIIAKSTPGMSGADLANIINESALLAARKGKAFVENGDIEDAKDKVMMGVERKSAVINDKEKKLTAYHEAGHVLVAKFTEDGDPVHKVTIIPRGRAMGVTHYIPIEDRHSYSRKYIMSKLLHLLGGRVAEEIIFDDVTTGAGNDIERATDLARKMVCEWGMSDEVGPIHYGVKNEDPFLGKQLTRTSSVSEKIGNEIDTAIQNIIFEALESTRKILSDNIELLHTLAKSLLERETLEGDEIDQVLKLGKFSEEGKEESEEVVETVENEQE